MKRFWLIGLFFLATHAFSQPPITKVLQLNYISVEQAIKLMRPLLQSGEQLSGTGQTLIAQVSPKTLTQIRTVLHQIDVAPITFNIMVYQGDPQWLSSQNNNSVNYSTQTQAQTLQSQSVKVINGDSALVTMNQEVPIVTAVGAGYLSGINYQQHQIKNGILVQPIMRGSQVQLKVRRLREQANPAGGQQFDNQKIETTLMAPINKWISIGSPMGAEPTDNSSTSFSAGRTFTQQSTLFIKVSIIGASSGSDNSNANAANGW